MFYYLGWISIFLLLLYVTHILSKHLRFIILSFLKICVAAGFTAVLAFAVYLNENRQHVQTIIQRVHQRFNQL